MLKCSKLNQGNINILGKYVKKEYLTNIHVYRT